MFQKVIIAGNLGRDPELRTTPNGQVVCSFSVATSRRWRSADGQNQEETVWFRVSAWGRQAEICKQYLAKGRSVLVEGRLTPDSNTGGPRVWTDQSGAARASFELNASEVRFLGGGRNENAPVGAGVGAGNVNESSSGSYGRYSGGMEEEAGGLGDATDDDMPF